MIGETSTSASILEERSERSATVGHLVQSLQEGVDPEEGFRHLFELYYVPVVKFFSRRGFPPDDCRDLAQETFLQVHRGLPRFRREASFDTWMFQIAANVYRNTLRRKSAEKRSAKEVSLDQQMERHGDEAGAEPRSVGVGGVVVGLQLQQALAREEVRLVCQAVTDLPAQMRRVFLLRIGQGLKYREIAELLQLSIDTVKSHLSQARTRLKERAAAESRPLMEGGESG